MEQRLHFYTIDLKYIRNLTKKDDNVRSISPQIGKSIRPLIGLLIMVNGKSYCAPLSSPKPKHESMKNSMDFFKLIDEKGKLIGVINFNNMIPVDKSLISLIDLKIKQSDSPQAKAYKELMNNQLDLCNKSENKKRIISNAQKLYKTVCEPTPTTSRILLKRCCDFKKLEEVLEKYLSKGLSQQQTNQSQQSEVKTGSSTPKKKFSISRKQMDENAKKISKQKSQISSPNKTKKKSNNGHTGR